MGLLTARLLAAQGWTVVATGRVLDAITPADRDAGIHAVRLDLGALANVDAFAESLPGLGLPPFRAVVCNAGFQNPGRLWSEDGYEATVAVNYLAQLRLVDRLVPLLAPSARIVWTASGTHDPDEVRMLPKALESATLDELVHPEALPARPIRDGFQRYAASKLCVVRAVPFLARELVGRATVNAFDPGLMPGTGLGRGQSPRIQALWNVVAPLALLAPGSHRPITSARHLAQLVTSPRFAAMTGAYVVDDHPAGTSIASYDFDAGERLYRDSLALAGAQLLGQGPGAVQL
jgi:NAD(P)-dependent dehydrogenase (short-subunit alcohol dehydrogenase family)